MANTADLVAFLREVRLFRDIPVPDLTALAGTLREHTLRKVPYLLVLGDIEVESQTLAVRDRKGQDLGVMGIGDFAARLGQAVEARTN